MRKQTELWLTSTADGTKQPSLFYKADGEQKRPLLVGLHTWSFDRFNQINAMLPYAEKYNFHLLLPEFRGPNLPNNPHCTEACASALAMSDIKDAVDYAITHGNADPDNLFLLGASGGGHMALMMAGKYPSLFRAVGAFVPITDLTKWVHENKRYTESILACTEGSEAEMRKRSPISYLDEIAKANVKLFHGKRDPSVPVAHSIDFFTAMVQKHPAASVYLDVFDGGHEMDMEQAMYWLLSQQSKGEKESVSG